MKIAQWLKGFGMRDGGPFENGKDFYQQVQRQITSVQNVLSRSGINVPGQAWICFTRARISRDHSGYGPPAVCVPDDLQDLALSREACLDTDGVERVADVIARRYGVEYADAPPPDRERS